jgi:hypothetical protein
MDYSDFIRIKKLTTISNANSAAKKTKFRALTVFDSYDPALVNQTGVIKNDYIRKIPHANNTFAAVQFKASRVAYFN